MKKIRFLLKTSKQIVVVSIVDKTDGHLKSGHVQINSYDVKMNYYVFTLEKILAATLHT